MWGMGSQDLGKAGCQLEPETVVGCVLLESMFICGPEVSCLEMMKSTGLGTTSWLCDLRA